MTLGVALMLGGAILRFGSVPLGWAAGSGDPVGGPSPAPTPAVASTGPGASSPAETNAPPADAGLWFADDFVTPAAWPAGDLGLIRAAVVEGRYVIDAEPTDLPVVITAAAGDGSPGEAGATILVQAGVTFVAGDAAASAGVVVADAEGTRLIVLLAADGRVALYRDSIESLDGLASASVAPPAGPTTVGLRLAGGTATVLVDGVAVTSAVVGLEPLVVGLAVWSPMMAATVAFGAYRAWVPAPA